MARKPKTRRMLAETADPSTEQSRDITDQMKRTPEMRYNRMLPLWVLQAQPRATSVIAGQEIPTALLWESAALHEQKLQPEQALAAAMAAPRASALREEQQRLFAKAMGLIPGASPVTPTER